MQDEICYNVPNAKANRKRSQTGALFLFYFMISKEAQIGLREILIKEFGKYTENFTDEQINEIGSALLRLTQICLKRDYRQFMVKNRDLISKQD